MQSHHKAWGRGCLSSDTWGLVLRPSVFQVVQLVLGVLSGILGGFLYIYQPTGFCYSGAAIWTGAVVSEAAGDNLPSEGLGLLRTTPNMVEQNVSYQKRP